MLRTFPSKSSYTASGPVKERTCYFCQRQMEYIDYKEAQLLRRFTSAYAKITTRKRSRVCARHQRKLAQAIKRARFMALLPYTVR